MAKRLQDLIQFCEDFNAAKSIFLNKFRHPYRYADGSLALGSLDENQNGSLLIYKQNKDLTFYCKHKPKSYHRPRLRYEAKSWVVTFCEDTITISQGMHDIIDGHVMYGLPIPMTEIQIVNTLTIQNGQINEEGAIQSRFVQKTGYYIINFNFTETTHLSEFSQIEVLEDLVRDLKGFSPKIEGAIRQYRTDFAPHVYTFFTTVETDNSIEKSPAPSDIAQLVIGYIGNK